MGQYDVVALNFLWLTRWDGCRSQKASKTTSFYCFFVTCGHKKFIFVTHKILQVIKTLLWNSIDYSKIVPFLNKIAITSLHIIYSRIDPCEIHIICCKAYNFLTRELYLETSGCSLIILSTMGILWNLCFWLKSDLKDIPLLREFISDL